MGKPLSIGCTTTRRSRRRPSTSAMLGWVDVPLSAPPDPFPAFNTCRVPAGTRLIRLHAPMFQGHEPNPCKGGLTRFAPLFQPGGACLPTLYAAASFECAVFESVFHDVPYTAAEKFVTLGRVTSRAISWLELGADLTLASLHEPDLNKIGLTRADLVDTPSSAYPDTARWAEAFHRAGPELAGLVWTSRRCDPGSGYVCFGGRMPSGPLKVTSRTEIATSARHFAQIRAFGNRAGITLTI